MSNSKTAPLQSNSLSFDSLWQTVLNNPTDFVSWTLLLQYCEHMKNTNSIREAYNEFLSNYPYCFAYWKKFAEFELQNSNHSIAFEVLERAIKAFPLSIDIWIFYIQIYIRFTKDVKEIISLFERAIKACGNDFNSSDLWSLYLSWMTSTRQDLSQVTSLYDRLLQIPITKLDKHFENFKLFVEDNNPICIISKKEYNLYILEYNNSKTISQENNNEDFNDNLLESNREICKESFDGEKSEESVAKILFIRTKIIDKRKRIYDITLKESEERKYFEDNIKRPYFHVNPLDIAQLDNWMQYLNWEIKNSCYSKIIRLFERCLISCALYENMWIRYLNYMMDKRNQMIQSKQQFDQHIGIDVIREVFQRATKIHVKKSFKLHHLWSLFEEQEGNFNHALSVLEKFDKENPNLIEVSLSKINLYHRKEDFKTVDSLYKTSIENLIDSPKLSSHLSLKYSRFLLKVIKNTELAVEVLKSALKRDPTNHSLYLGLIDIEYQKNNFNITRIENLFDEAIGLSSISMKLVMIQRKLQFMQDFGCDCDKIRTTINRMQNLMHGFDEEKNSNSDSFETETVKRFKVENDSSKLLTLNQDFLSDSNCQKI